jgi:hypothetical protein
MRRQATLTSTLLWLCLCLLSFLFISNLSLSHGFLLNCHGGCEFISYRLHCISHISCTLIKTRNHQASYFISWS